MDINESGTAGEVRTKLQKAPSDNSPTDRAILSTLDEVLGSVSTDRQATVRASVRTTPDLLQVYVDVTIVPSAATQEARADASRPMAITSDNDEQAPITG